MTTQNEQSGPDAPTGPSGSEVGGVLVFGLPTGTLEVHAHPDDVIDVDPVVLARMNARLSGKNFDDFYDADDNVSSAFLLRKQVEKLRRVFGSAREVNLRYTSILSIREIHLDLNSEGLDRDFFEKYASKKWPTTMIDECDLFRSLLDNSDAFSKPARMASAHKNLSLVSKIGAGLLQALSQSYLSEQLSHLQITKEILQLEPQVRRLVKADFAVGEMNALLRVFYGGAA